MKSRVTIFLFCLFFCSILVPQKTYAQYVDVAQLSKEFGLDTIAYQLANTIIKKLSAQTVNWINSGFKGNPAYVTNPDQFFLDIGDETASKFLSDTNLNQLCSPFKAQVRLALVKNYLRETDNRSYSCTLSKVKDNYEEFINDFDQGGWEGWFEVTQRSQNNPYGAYLETQNSLNIQIGNEKNKKTKQLDWGNGFLSYEKCAGTEVQVRAICPDGTVPPTYPDGSPGLCSFGEKPKPAYTECSGKKEIVTPGSVIQNQLNKTLGSGLGRLEAADEINEIIGALMNQLMSRVIGGIGNGLKGASEKSTASSGKSFADQLRDEIEPPPSPPPNYGGSSSGRMSCNDDGTECNIGIGDTSVSAPPNSSVPTEPEPQPTL